MLLVRACAADVYKRQDLDSFRLRSRSKGYGPDYPHDRPHQRLKQSGSPGRQKGKKRPPKLREHRGTGKMCIRDRYTRADKALYQAKEKGRDRYQIWETDCLLYTSRCV